MKHFNLLAATVLPALLLSAGIRANEPIRDKDSADMALEGQGTDLVDPPSESKGLFQRFKEKISGSKVKKEEPAPIGTEKKEEEKPTTGKVEPKKGTLWQRLFGTTPKVTPQEVTPQAEPPTVTGEVPNMIPDVKPGSVSGPSHTLRDRIESGFERVAKFITEFFSRFRSKPSLAQKPAETPIKEGEEEEPPIEERKGLPVEPAGPEHKIVAMGDVEGSWKKVFSFCESNDSVKFENGKFVFKDQNSKFISLGDIEDNGAEGIGIKQALVEFHDNNPGRVVLLMGNRDINKTRLNWELSLDGMKKDIGADRGDPFQTIWSMAFAKWLEKEQNKPKPNQYYANYKKRDPFGDIITRLAWLTANTYGAGKFFENIKTEKNLSDEETVRYISGYTKKGGVYYEYQKRAKLIYYDEPTKTIFAHGGIFHPDALGYTPWNNKTMPVTNNDDLIAWTDALNDWAKQMVELGTTANGKKPEVVKQVLQLINYQEPKGDPELLEPGKTDAENGEGELNRPAWGSKNNDLSVVVGRPWVNGNFSLKNVPMKRLFNAGVIRMVVGHSPIGQVPIFARSDEKFGGQPFEVVDADTTYANPDPRVTAVTIGEKSGVTIEGPFRFKVSTTARTQNLAKTDEKITYSSTADDELGKGREEDLNYKDTNGNDVTVKAIYWNLGKAKNRRIYVTFPPYGANPTYYSAPEDAEWKQLVPVPVH